MHSGAVDDGAGRERTPVLACHAVGERLVAACPLLRRLAAHGHDLRVEEELRAVRRRVLGVPESQLVGAADAAGRRPQRGDGGAGDVRLAAAKLVAGDDLSRHPVLLAARLELGQGLLVFRVERQDKRPVAAERDLQLAAHVLEHAVAEDIELRLVRTGLRVETGVDDRAVGLGRALGDIAPRLQDEDVQVVAGQLARDCAAHHSRANDYDICFHADYYLILGARVQWQRVVSLS